MHFHTLALLAILGTTLALPHTNQTDISSTLEKRQHYPWIGAYDNPICNAGPKGNRPELRGMNCVPFNPQFDAVGISWGSGMLRIYKLAVFTDNACITPAADPVWQPKGSKGFDCVSVADINSRGPNSPSQVNWGSVLPVGDK